MNEHTSEIIAGGRDFALSINEWSGQTIMFVCALLMVIVAFVNVYFFIKNSNKTSDKILDVVDKNTKGYSELSKAIDAQNATNIKTLEHIETSLDKNLEMHRKTHGDLSDLKWMLQGKIHEKAINYEK